MQIELTAAELELIQAALHELKRRKKQRIENEQRRGVTGHIETHEKRIQEAETLYAKVDVLRGIH